MGYVSAPCMLHMTILAGACALVACPAALSLSLSLRRCKAKQESRCRFLPLLLPLSLSLSLSRFLALSLSHSQDYYIGDEALAHTTTHQINWPITSGQVRNWDNMEKLWQQCIFKYLRCDPEDHLFLLTEPPMNAYVLCPFLHSLNFFLPISLI